MTGACEQAVDHELLRSALAGDARVRRQLVERLVPTVRARVLHALLRYKSHEQAAQVTEDLTQQVFLLLFEDGGRRLRAWTPGRGASLATFVGLVSEREVIAILRRGRRNPWTESPTDHDELVGRVGAGEDQASLVERRELLDAVLDKALATLDERGLLLFRRIIVDEAPVATVAGEMATSIAALYMWKSRFAKLVREIAERLARDSAPMPTARPVSLLLPNIARTR